MAELDKSLSQLDATTTIPTGTLFFVSIEDLQAASGYSSRKIASENVVSQILTAYSLNALNTTSKNIVGAVNELNGTKLTGTLTAGSTSITFSDASITSTSLIEVYNDAGIGWESITATTGSVTITFEEQAADLAVEVIVK